MTKLDRELDREIVEVTLGGKTVAILCVPDKEQDKLRIHGCIEQVIKDFGFTDVSDYVESYPGKFSPMSISLREHPFFKNNPDLLLQKENTDSCFYEYAGGLIIFGGADMIYGYDVSKELETCFIYPSVKKMKLTKEYNKTKDKRFLDLCVDEEEDK